ncbi:MAG TPA: glycoside hydrolase family 38 C-terminal domain-containing protein, partial [Acidimicrobiales bacterium]|nr:glycoside hydrolase family 38 C-terminal domain-containing protein [Acidimicrobiales bacterium]
MAPRRISIVPHTHWDREWYEPFQTFRLRLVHLIDGLLDLLESDPSYSRFLLDGQMAVIDDYLEIRPENEERIRALAASGRLTMGPWYILMDEFLVSGETIIRDLQMGMERGAAFGGVAEIGYLPDMFGHIGQMPQILRMAGFEHAVVWRGVPSVIDKTGFWWEAPDGSSVRAEYLVVGYGNGAAVPDDAKALVRRIADHEKEIDSFLVDGLLFMNGTDHQEPQTWLGPVVAEANAIQDDYVLEVTALADYLVTTPTKGLPSWKGELRSGARANVLMGVASNRVDVKREAARAERALERRAEPYSALYLPAPKWPQALLDVAWKEMIRNAAHDSVCACSVDEVVDAVLTRYAEARRVGEGLADQALLALARSFAEAGPVAVNPSPRARSGLVEMVVTGDEVPADTQALPDEPGAFGIPRGLGALTLDANTVRTILGMLPSGSQIDTHTWIQGVEVDENDTGIDITISFGSEERFDVPLASIKQDLYTRLGARPDSVVRIRIDQPPIRRVLARVTDVPGFGWRSCQPAGLAHPVVVETTPAAGGTAGSTVLSNGLVTVAFDGTSGTFALDGVAGFGRLVDDGDHGDSYNYSPPLHDTVVDTPESVSVSAVEQGPVKASVLITAVYRWPEYVDGTSRARTGERTVEVSTTVELRADERIVRVVTRFVNPSRDHRLRVHLPLPRPATHSEAECAFAVVRRGLEAEGRPDEFGLPTFPSRRFVSAGGLTVAHEGLLEYELIDVEGGASGTAGTLAVTLLRSTGMLSRLGMAYRPLPAGPITPVDGLQLQGQPIEARYALSLECDDPYALADDAFLPLELVHAPGGGPRPMVGSALEIVGAEVSAVRRV